MGRTAIGAATVCLIVACDAGTWPSEPVAERPSAAMVVNERTTLDTVVNSCTGEDVALSGGTHVVFSVTPSANGGFHLRFHMNETLRGTGLSSGNRYNYINISNFTLNANVLPFEQTSVFTNLLVGSGKADDLRVHGLQHITVDASGNLRVFNSDFRFECR